MISTAMTLAEALRQVAGEHPRREALVCGEVRATYGQLVERATGLASGLQGLGIGKGDKVAALLSPGPEFVYLLFGVAQLGAVFVPLNPQLRRRHLAHILQNVQPVAAVVSGRSADLSAVRELQPDVPGLRHLILAEGGTASDLCLEDLMSGAPTVGFSPAEVEPDDLFIILHTSGTTGLPKGAMHNHRSLIAPVVASLKLREMWQKGLSLKRFRRTARVVARYRGRLLRAAGRPQTFLSTTGWHTITGIEVLLQALLMGDRLVVMPHFHPVEALQLVERERVTVLIAVPLAFAVMLRLQDFDRYDLSSLLICGTGSAPCPPELARQIQQRFGCALHIGFGTTELAGGIAATSLEDSDALQAETVGQAMPGIEVRVVDEARRELPPGQVGELAVRSDSLMMGYYGAPERTAEVVDQKGWYYTGDLAIVDEQGYLRILGRKDDMIIRGGQNIYPAEIEAHLVTHEKIREAAVVGVPGELGEERAWAFVILEEGEEMKPQEVLDHCRAELELYQLPHQVRFVADFPRASGGKPQKFELRKMALEEDLGKTLTRRNEWRNRSSATSPLSNSGRSSPMS